jgi:hypothetical protein
MGQAVEDRYLYSFNFSPTEWSGEINPQLEFKHRVSNIGY